MSLKQSLFSRKSLLLTLLLTTMGIFYVGLLGQSTYDKSLVFNGNVAPAQPRQVTSNETNTGKKLQAALSKVRNELQLQRSLIEDSQVKPEDLMKAGPFNFLPNYRNPCWESATNKKQPIKCLPYFYIMGAPKAGTTDLYYRIVQHPSVSSLTKKEPHWLPRSHFYTGSLSHKAKPSLDDYIEMFKNAIGDVQRDEEDNDWHPKVFADGSASTLWDNDYWKTLPEFSNLTEPKYTNPDYIHHLNPNTKCIAILRNPVERLYSDYLFFAGSKKDPNVFHQSVLDGIDYYYGCLRNRTLRSCVYHKPPLISGKIRLRIGIYSVHLKEYFRVFPRKQILVLKLEEYSKNITSSLEKVFRFLKLEPVTDGQTLYKMTAMKKRNIRRPADKAVGEMLPETRRLLQEFYYPYNIELAKLLGKQFNYNNDDVGE